MRFYISSTYADLAEHRRAVIDVIRELHRRHQDDHVPYEYFDLEALSPSGNPPPLEACIHDVQESDYFILLVGWRYGYIPEDAEKSIVELEYDAAVEKSMPRFCFFIDDDYAVSPKYIEIGEGARKLERFKQRVQEKNVSITFTTPEDLARQVTMSLSVLDRPMSDAMHAMIEYPVLEREYRRHREEAKVLMETVDDYKEKLSRIVPADPIWNGRNFQQDNSLCFVLMPFSDEYFAIYEEAIVPAVKSAGLRALHAGEIFGNREIMEDIWESISVARLVVADVTGRNPNVFYELGIAHTLGKECVVLTQQSCDVPFDISSRRFLQYEQDKLISLKTKLEKTIKSILL